MLAGHHHTPPAEGQGQQREASHGGVCHLISTIGNLEPAPELVNAKEVKNN